MGADSFIENLLRIIKHMKPKHEDEKEPKTKMDKLAKNLPFLALPNDATKKQEVKKEVKEEKDNQEVDDMMNFLEAMAPSKRETSKSPERKRKDRKSESSRRRSRSRSRSRDRDDRRKDRSKKR